MKEKEAIEYLDLKSLVPFRNHPFKLRNGEEKEQLLKSIKTQGTIEPLIVRPLSESEYEVISGHRRLEICKELGRIVLSIHCTQMARNPSFLP